jgi:hypothetical protein
VLPVEFWAYLNFALLHGGAVLTLRAVPDEVLPRLARACDAALVPREPDEAGSGGDHLPPGARPLAIAVPSGSRGEGHLETPRDTAFSAPAWPAEPTSPTPAATPRPRRRLRRRPIANHC